jgi:mannosyl-oligosaccharide alpha-1,2-mannosidase
MLSVAAASVAILVRSLRSAGPSAFACAGDVDCARGGGVLDASRLYGRRFPVVGADVARREAVKEAFVHAWRNYERHCFGRDELRPVSHMCRDWLSSSELTIIDSLSTLLVMNLTYEFRRARAFVASGFAPAGRWVLFEFVIRYLGGLLSAAELSGDRTLIDTATGLGYAVLPLIENGNRDIWIETNGPRNFSAGGSRRGGCIAEAAMNQIELLTLAKLTGDARFVRAATRFWEAAWRRSDGLLGSHLGACQDSYYEYVIKSFVLTRGTSPEMLRRHVMAVLDIRRHLVVTTRRRRLVAIGDARRRVEHLTAFAAGMFAVGAAAKADLTLAAQLADTYATIARETRAGVMGERLRLGGSTEREWEYEDDTYRLRPEAVESIYIIWKFTGLKKFRDDAWEMFVAINCSCRVEGGFGALRRSDQEDPIVLDVMGTFFLAETLKYLYLTFEDSRILSPGEWVFNTEGHPVRIWDPRTAKKFARLLRSKSWQPRQRRNRPIGKDRPARGSRSW